ncbi:hypothetical protein K2X85_17815 [bacterium]|jgi:outer membrane lipoprotein SlyB|nr:hypothetical protein [bacterium]
MSSSWINGIVGTGLLLASTGCETVAQRGALGGAALGAGAGALIGSATADAGKGALIGGALGTIAGALTGAAIDNAEERATAKAIAHQEAAGAMTVADVITMSQSGVSEQTIVASIRSSSSGFRLAAADVVHLHESGVSDKVIQAMMDKRPTVVAAGRPVYVHEAPVYIYDRCPPPVVIGYHGCWW